MRGTRSPYDSRPGERAQAYTLEGVVGAVLILTALLFTMQSLVLVPTTEGSVDGTARAGIHERARDVLTTGASDGSLSRTVRYWNNSTAEGTFAGGIRPSVGYADATPPTGFGALLDDQFGDDGYRYNVVVAYQVAVDPSGWETLPVVYHGVPSEDAVVATYAVTLYDDDELTGPRSGDETLAAAHRAGQYPIPDAAPKGPVFNVVEVRLVVW